MFTVLTESITTNSSQSGWPLAAVSRMSMLLRIGCSYWPRKSLCSILRSLAALPGLIIISGFAAEAKENASASNSDPARSQP